MGKVVAVTSSKGGVGKTLFSLCLSGVFAHLHEKTVIVDFDLLTGGIALSLDSTSEKTIYDLYKDIKLDNIEIITKYVEKYNDYIDVISCPKDPRESELIDPIFIERIIHFLKNLYDVVVIDTNHNLININNIIFKNSSEILHIITNDPIDLKNTKNTLALLDVNNITNYKIIYNQSRDTGKDYFSTFDIKNIIQNNIDYTIPNSFYINEIDRFTIDGEIITLNKKLMSQHKDTYRKLQKIAETILHIDK